MKTVAQLIEQLSAYSPDMKVFYAYEQYNGYTEKMVVEAVWGHMHVQRVTYPVPHIGEFYGDALVIGIDEDCEDLR